MYEEIFKALEAQLSLCTIVEQDKDVRKVYLQKSLQFLHKIKKEQLLSEQEYHYLVTVRNKINDCWRNYLKGRMNTASAQMQNLLRYPYQKHKCYMDMFANVQQYPNVFYRGREDNKPLKEEKEFYHIPFTKRYLIKNQRYSISGIPCLYLASSRECMYKELGNQHVPYCQFHMTKKIAMLDMSISYEQMLNQTLTHEQVFAFLCTMPLKYAVSIQALDNERQSFKSNYVIAQLLTAAIYNMKTIRVKGICYASIKGRELPYEQRLNYVFLPVCKHMGQEYDMDLMHCFHLDIMKAHTKLFVSA